MSHFKILIVEDEILTARMLQRKVEKMNYHVLGPVASGDKALSIAIEENPSIVLMDINLLGKKDGINSAKDICANISTNIIFITGYDDKELKMKAMDIEPAGYLVKPVNINQLFKLISKTLTVK